MKKLLLLTLTLLLSVGTTWATNPQVTETGTNTLNAATIKSKADAGTLLVSIQNHTTSANNYINKEGKAVSSFDVQNGTTTWQVVSHNGAYALKNCDGKYIMGATRPVTFTSDISQALLFMPTDCEANVGDIDPEYNSSQAVRWIVNGSSNTMNTNGMNTSTTVQFNTGRGNWTCLFTYEVLYKYEITFSCKVGETLIYTESGYYKDGSSVNVPDLPGYTASPTSVTVAGDDASHDIAYTVSSYPVNFPRSQSFTRSDRHINSVTFASDVNSPVVNGLYENTSTLCYQDFTASKTVTLPPRTSVKPSFSMEGNWQHGFVYIDLNDDGDFTDDGELVSYYNDGNPNLSSAMPSFMTPASGNYRMRIKSDWSTTDPGGNIGDAPHRITDNNHIIANGGMIVDVTLEIPEDYTSALTAITKPFTDYPAATGYFRMTSTNATSFLGMIATAKSDEIIDAEEYAELLESFKGFVRFPSTGYYLIKNSSSNNYMAYGTPGESGKAVGLITTEGDITPANIILLTKVGFNEYTISSQGLNVQARAGANNTFPMSSSDGVVFSFVPQNATSLKITNSDSYVSNTNPGTLFEAHWTKPYAVVNWEPSGEQGQWTVEDVSTITIPLTAANDNSGTAHTYATLCVPFAISNLTGANSKEVKAYAPTKDGDYIVPGTGATTVTKGTPVLLIGEEGATSVTATIGSNYATTHATTNVLTGTFTGATIDCSTESNNYVLGFDSENDNRIGFYHVSEGSSFALGANRAYLKLDNNGDPTHVKGFMISFDEDEETGINSIENGKLKIENEAVYDLSGRRIAKPTKGLYIVGGRKVIVK